jgi:hypothetical protein
MPALLRSCEPMGGVFESCSIGLVRVHFFLPTCPLRWFTAHLIFCEYESRQAVRIFSSYIWSLLHAFDKAVV